MGIQASSRTTSNRGGEGGSTGRAEGAAPDSAVRASAKRVDFETRRTCAETLSRRLELQLRLLDRHERPELVDVVVAVHVERRERREVERGRGHFHHERPGAEEVVVAVDQDARLLR